MENGPIPPDGFLSKSAPPELINMAGDGIPHPQQLDSLSDDFMSLRKDGLVPRPGTSPLLGGSKHCGVSVEERKASVTPTLGTAPNTLHITPAMAQGINADIKHQLMKEVRKFGRSK